MTKQGFTKIWIVFQLMYDRNHYFGLGPIPKHSDLNDQNLFHSTIDAPPGVPGVSKNPDAQTEVHSGEFER